MSTLRLLSAAALLTVAASAHASSFIATTDAIVGTLKATTDLTSDATNSIRDNKIVRAARDDIRDGIGGRPLTGALRHAAREARQGCRGRLLRKDRAHVQLCDVDAVRHVRPL